jgi:hypothetical protein
MLWIVECLRKSAATHRPTATINMRTPWAATVAASSTGSVGGVGRFQNVSAESNRIGRDAHASFLPAPSIVRRLPPLGRTKAMKCRCPTETHGHKAGKCNNLNGTGSHV